MIAPVDSYVLLVQHWIESNHMYLYIGRHITCQTFIYGRGKYRVDYCTFPRYDISFNFFFTTVPQNITLCSVI